MTKAARQYLSFLPLTFLGLSLTAVVQAEEGVIEEIVVTGSYIKGTPGDTPSPVQTIRRQDIVASGVSDVAELIRNLEIASGSDTAPSDNTRFNGSAGSGLANINLRGLGPTSTLVLLDGKRLPYAGQKISNGDRFVDINAIPITMIERVEVLKNGASATYGSDAIAGVVNFITRRDFEGFEVSGKFQSVDQGDQDDATFGAVFGWGSDEGKTHFVIGGEYFDRSSMDASDRYDLRRDLFPRQGGEIVNRFSFTGLDPNCLNTGLGLFSDNDTNSDPFVCQRVGADTEEMIPEQQRTSIMATAYHTFSESFELYGQISYANGNSGSSRNVQSGPIEPKFFMPSLLGLTSAAPFIPDPFTGGAPNDPSTIPNGGPLPAAPIPMVVPLPLEIADFQLRVPGLDPQRKFNARNESDTWRFQLGARGDFDFAEKPWSYDVSLTHGTNQFSTFGLAIDKDRLELAMYGLGGPTCTPNGTLNPADPRAATARFLLSGTDGMFNDLATAPGAVGPLESTMLALMGTVPNFPFINPDNLVLGMTSNNNGDHSQGCYFYNPFLSRQNNPTLANSDELLRWMEVPVKAQQTDTYLTSFDVVFSGELFELNGNIASLAVGAQYREEGRETAVHRQITGSVNSFGQMAGGESVGGLSENLNFDADRDIYAVFAELALPLTDDIDIQLAARYEDYGSAIGSTFDPKIGVRWQTTDSLVLRAAASSSFRGPALAQIEEGTGFSLEFGVRDVLGEQSRPEGDNCVRTGRCEILDPTLAPTIIIVKQGRPSPDLEPETAVSWNIGAIWSPQEGPLAGLTVGVDYYNINFEDKIIDVPTQAFLTEEVVLFQQALAAGDFVIVNPTLGNIGTSCDPTNAIFDPGAAQSESCQVNPSAYAISAANSSFDGNITRRTDNSRDLQIIASNAINTGKVETSGIDLHLGYVRSTDYGQFVFDSRLNWIEKFDVKDFPVGQPDFDAAGFTNRSPTRRLASSMPDLKGSASLTWLYDDHIARLGMRYIGSYTDNAAIVLERSFDPYYAFDFSYTYTLDFEASGQLLLTLGAIDLLDADLPNVRDSRGVDLTVFDQRGRRFYASMTYRM
ncbi:MAG: TonB-dependent receptor [Gammaproteobacteria bacterium]|nr:TonB-dependent receptor [Gammaproteobacteria bacterium]